MNFIPRLLARVLVALVFCAGAIGSAQAQSWPSRPISLIIAFGGGGSGDLVARTFAEFASKELGQPVVIDNRPGGGGVVAALAVSKSTPDGYTVALQAVGPMSLRTLMEPPVGYDPVKDFTPVGLLADTPNVLVSGPKNPATTLAELVDWAKKNPGTLTMGHPGPGTMGHLGAALLASSAGFNGTYIAYRSSGHILPDLLGGQIDMACAAYTPLFKGARILAVMTPEPVEFLPGVPTTRQAGFPGVYASTWYAVFGPPGLPQDVVAKLNAVINAFVRSEDGKTKLTATGFQGLGGSPGDLTKKLAEDKLQWSKVIKDANVKMGDP